MARMGFAPLVLALASAPAWAQSSPNFGTGLQPAMERDPSKAYYRNFTIGESAWLEPESNISITTKVGPNVTAGLGIYGFRQQMNYAPVTARDLAVPKSRRAGVGITLKF